MIWMLADPLLLRFFRANTSKFYRGTPKPQPLLVEREVNFITFAQVGSPADAAQYLAEERSGYPNPPYAAFQWANTHLPPKAKVLLIGDERPFYLERNRLSASLYVRQPLLFFIETSSSSTELYQKFLREGITHVLINKEEYLRTHDPLTLSAAKTRLLDSFWKKHLQLIHVDPGTNERDDWDFAFYRLAPSVNPRAVCAVPYFLIKKSSRK